MAITGGLTRSGHSGAHVIFYFEMHATQIGLEDNSLSSLPSSKLVVLETLLHEAPATEEGHRDHRPIWRLTFSRTRFLQDAGAIRRE
jgi:hypothetical protein